MQVYGSLLHQGAQLLNQGYAYLSESEETTSQFNKTPSRSWSFYVLTGSAIVGLICFVAGLVFGNYYAALAGAGLFLTGAFGAYQVRQPSLPITFARMLERLEKLTGKLLTSNAAKNPAQPKKDHSTLVDNLSSNLQKANKEVERLTTQVKSLEAELQKYTDPAREKQKEQCHAELKEAIAALQHCDRVPNEAKIWSAVKALMRSKKGKVTITFVGNDLQVTSSI